MRKWTKNIALLLCLALLAGGLLACAQENPAPAQPGEATPAPAQPEATAGIVPPIANLTGEEKVMHFTQMLIAGQYEATEAMLADAVATQVAALGGMEAFMDILLKDTGAWQAIDGEAAQLVQQGDITVYVLTLTAEQGQFTMQVSVDGEGKIAGFSVLPTTVAEEPLVMPEGYTEEPVTVDAGTGYPLEGRLVFSPLLSSKSAVVILVQGSGPLDYDETVGANRVFGKIAKGLAERGIATLRYDKRTYAYPDIGQAGDFSVKEEYVQDVLAAVELLKTKAWVDTENIFILGHSEGGMLAPMFLEEGAGAKGMILLAGTPRKFMDILKDQQQDLLDYYEANGMQAQADAYRELQAGWEAEAEAWRNMSEEETKSAGPVYGMGAYYLYVLEQYDAIDAIERLKKPTLILQGSKDVQVYAEKDYALYEEALSGKDYVQMKLYEGLGHMFTPSTASSIMEAQQEYNTPAEIPAEVLDDIAGWVRDNLS